MVHLDFWCVDVNFKCSLKDHSLWMSGHNVGKQRTSTFLPTLIWSTSCVIVPAPDRTIAIRNTGGRGLLNRRGLLSGRELLGGRGSLGGRGLFCEKALLGGWGGGGGGGGLGGQLKKNKNPQVLSYLP